MNIFNKISTLLQQNKVIILIDQLMVSACNFLMGILLIRWLGLEQYGVFAIAWMVVLFALNVNQSWIVKPMQSLVPQISEEDQDQEFAVLQAMQLLTGGLVLFIGLALIGLSTVVDVAADYTHYIPIMTILTIVIVIHDFYRKLLFIKGRFKTALLMDCILYPGQILLLIGLYFSGEINLLYTFYALFICALLSVLFAWKNLGVRIIWTTKIIKEKIISFFHFSKWLLGTSLLQWLSGNYFIIIGVTILGPIAIGAVRMAQQVIGLTHVLFLAMESIVPVEAARHYGSGNKTALFSYLKKTTLQASLVVGIILTTMAFTAPQLIKYLYGAEYLEYSYVITSFCFIYIFVFFGYPLRFALRTMEHTKAIFLAYLYSTIFSLMLANPILNYWGLPGLLAGMGLTQVISLGTYIVSLRLFLKKNSSTKNSSTTPVQTFSQT